MQRTCREALKGFGTTPSLAFVARWSGSPQEAPFEEAEKAIKEWLLDVQEELRDLAQELE